MKYLAVLGRLADISLAELTAQFGASVRRIGPNTAVFESNTAPDIDRFGGVMKFGFLMESDAVEFLKNLPDLSMKEFIGQAGNAIGAAALPKYGSKITFGISDYSRGASARSAQREAMKIKKILAKSGRSARVLSNTAAELSSATSHHNQLGEKAGHIEIMISGREWYIGCGVQNITAYRNRDQVRPARDAKVGMLPPKLAQILIDLCGPLKPGSTVLDPFCGTGVVLQEAALDGYIPLGSDLSARMVSYTKKNLAWLLNGEAHLDKTFTKKIVVKPDDDLKIFEGDATNFDWSAALAGTKIDAVACETYLGQPMSLPPADVKLRSEKEICRNIVLGFLKNLYPQIDAGTPIALAIPAWRRPDGSYSRLNILDEIVSLGYNHEKHLSQGESLYFREGQVVAREIIVLRKK